MVLTTHITKIVSQYNLRIFRDFGYKIGDFAKVDIKDWNKNSHDKVEVRCDVCGFEKMLSYREYNRSLLKYELYACSSKCSKFKNKLTNKLLYGDENYYNIDKCKSTCLERYGVDNVFKRKDVISKIDVTKRVKYGEKHELVFDKVRFKVLDKYGVDNISKSEYAKELKKKTCFSNFGVYHPFQSEVIRAKSIKTCLIRYGYKYPMQSDIINMKRQSTCLEKYDANSYVESDDYLKKINLRYGVNNYVESDDYLKKINSKFNYTIKRPYDLIKIWYDSEDFLNRKSSIYDMIKESNIKNGNWFKPYKDDYIIYRRRVDFLTKKNKKLLFTNWDGVDYYDNEYILDNFKLSSNNISYPTVDHKISVLNGYLNNISIDEISSIDNLCITKRTLNSKKNSKNESEFILLIN